VLAAADLVFYVILTPIWIGLRAVAWAADLRSRTSTSLRGGERKE
jgi:hypothetical protein